jgi:hypothetical protein
MTTRVTTCLFRRRGCAIMRALLSALLLLPVFFPCCCYAWTTGEWLGVIEAAAGTVVLKARNSPSSDVCENCNGTGHLGDGTVSVECPVCEGTGKPVQPGKVYSSQQDCASCASHATINSNPSPPGMDAPAVKQEAATSGGGTYKRGLFRRR